MQYIVQIVPAFLRVAFNVEVCISQKADLK